MDRRHLVGLIIAASLTGTLASASTFADEIVRQLQGDGYSEIVIETTWLGRVRITAVIDGGAREIILNPSTGEILRDLWIASSSGTISPRLIKDPAKAATKTDDDSTSDGRSATGSGSATDNGSGSGRSDRGDDSDDGDDSDQDNNDDNEDTDPAGRN